VADTPGQGIVLTRNPSYRGARPHRLARIVVAVDIPPGRALAQVEAGTADYGGVDPTDYGALAARYGPASPAARRGRQRYFSRTGPQLDFLGLNPHRPAFADVRLRRAVNYALDRAALARLGDAFDPLPAHPTDHYLPPGVAGYRDVHVYPRSPDLATARRLARGHAGQTVVLYTCRDATCAEQAQIVTADLAAIGLRVEFKAFSQTTLNTKLATPGEPFDLAWVGWLADFFDPDAWLNVLLDGSQFPALKDPADQARLAAAARLSGPARYRAYARLDTRLARDSAPFAALDNLSSHDFFSARMGCQSYGPYGIDLATLCIR
jgi:peptide/nickel transport system substrate-binding protein